MAAAKAKQKRFTMDTAGFVRIWRNHHNHDKNNDWTKFVLAVFERFTTGNETSNQETLTAHNKNWRRWNDEAKFEYLSEKCYSKAIGIKRAQEKIGNTDVELCDGYKNRKGSTASKRLTPDDIRNIWEGNDK